MRWTSILAIYMLFWSLSVFLVLPFGVRNQIDTGEYIQGTEPGAPLVPMWRRRVLWTTLVSIPVTAILMCALSAQWLQQYWS